MAGRGRGRGWGGRGGGFAPQLPFDLFPEGVEMPEVKIGDIDANTKKLLQWSSRFQNYWKASPYLLEERTSKKRQWMHIARFSDKKTNDFTRDSLSQILMFNDFPHELVQGVINGMGCQGSGCVLFIQKVFLSGCQEKSFDGTQSQTDEDVCVTEMKKKIDFFEQQEKTNQGKEETDENEKKDGDEDEDENAQEEDEEDISDDDYNQNIDFDDDEDDYNDADDGDDEPTY